MPQNCKTQDFFVKSNIYTSLESQKLQVLEEICQQFSRAGCRGNGPNSLKNFFFKNYNIIYHRKDNLKLSNIYNKTYNHFHNIWDFLNVLPNFCFTTNETMDDYHLWTWYSRVASRVAKRLKTSGLRKLGNIRKVPKLHRMIA